MTNDSKLSVEQYLTIIDYDVSCKQSDFFILGMLVAIQDAEWAKEFISHAPGCDDPQDEHLRSDIPKVVMDIVSW